MDTLSKILMPRSSRLLKGSLLSGATLYAPLWYEKMQGSSFLTMDNNHYTFAATNATYGSTGRTMAATGRLVYTAANWMATDSYGSILAWVNFTDAADHHVIFSSSDTAGATNYWAFGVLDTTGTLYVVQRNADVADYITATNNVYGAWHLVAITSTGTAWAMAVDGVAEVLNIGGGANTGDWMADTTDRDNVVIGALVQNVISGQANGIIGDVIYFSNKTVSLSQQLAIRNATEWVYP